MVHVQIVFLAIEVQCIRNVEIIMLLIFVCKQSLSIDFPYIYVDFFQTNVISTVHINKTKVYSLFANFHFWINL